MSHIFISYSTKDKFYALRLADFLRKKRFNVWIDRYKIEAGTNWWHEIVKGVKNCAAFVVLMTPDSEKSPWVQREVFLALSEEKKIFPILLKGNNWDIFVLHQFVTVFDEKLPEDEFLIPLGKVVRQQPESGEIYTVKPEHLALNPVTVNDYSAIEQAKHALENDNTSAALDLLGQAMVSDRETNIVESESLEQVLLNKIAREKLYKVILLMVAANEGHDIIRNALHFYHKYFAGYDPENLLERFSNSVPFTEKTMPPLSSEQQRIFDTINNPNTKPYERLKVGNRLAEVGDPRRGVGVDEDGLPDFDWVKIAAGEFIYQNNQRITLPKFHIAKYPVTYQQFQVFINAQDGYKNDYWWRGFGKHIQKASKEKAKYSNHPIREVNWYEAVAFCHWLSYRLTNKTFSIETMLSWPIRLPTGQEWERAARGTDGRRYPWGNEYIPNYTNCASIVKIISDFNDIHYLIEETTPVGVFPHGASPDGVLDMIGNIWEWTLSTNFPKGNVGGIYDGDYEGACCGGSFNYLGSQINVMKRLWLPLARRAEDIGFRVACFRDICS